MPIPPPPHVNHFDLVHYNIKQIHDFTLNWFYPAIAAINPFVTDKTYNTSCRYVRIREPPPPLERLKNLW